MAPRSSVVTLLFLLLTTVSSRALQPEGPTVNECRGHIEAAIKNFLSGQQKEDTTEAFPTAEIYTRAQSNQDFVAEHDGDYDDDDDDNDVITTLDDHHETEDEETTIETPEHDHIKHDEKREVETGDVDGDDDDDDDDHDDDDDDDDKKEGEEQNGAGEADDTEDEPAKKVAEHHHHDDDGDDDNDEDDDDDEDDHVKKVEQPDDDDDDDDDDGHVKKVAEHDDEDEKDEDVKEVGEHPETDDDEEDEDEAASHAEKVDHEQPEDDDDDALDDHAHDKEDDKKKDVEEEDENEEQEEAAVEEKETEEEEVEVQIEAPPAASDRFQKDEEASEGDDQGTPDTEAAEEDEEEDKEIEDRVERAAEEDGADQDEAQADDDQDDDESDKHDEQSPDGGAAPASETEDSDQPEADQPAHAAEDDDEEHDDVPDEPTGEPEEEEGKETKEEGEGGDAEEDEGREEEGGDEEGKEEEEEVIVAGPGQLRTRENIENILGLGEDSIDDNMEHEKIGGEILKEIKRMYEGAVRPLEQLYKFKDISTRQLGDAEIFSKPMVLFLGPWSTGKSAIINYMLGTEYSRYALKTGAEPTSNSFNVIMYGDSDQVLDGTQLAADWAFSTLQKFGQSFLDRLRGRKMSNPLLQKMTIVDSPGILENRKSTERQYPFNDAFQWFIDRADLIYIVFDPTKLDIGMELEAIFDQLKGRESQVRILLNKADTVKPQELMKVQGTLLWNLSPLLATSEAPTVYVGSFWSRPYLPGSPETLLDAQEEAFLEDLHDALENRVENKVALSRRHAVRVRNHAKMVDCYLNTYYNHKSFFSNKRKVADDIVENPQNYHIYEGLSILTNVSRYDLPDPDIYRDFFRIHPLFDFKPLASTCSYFKGCPLDKLDIAIAYDLPELVGKYQRLMGNRSVVGGR